MSVTAPDDRLQEREPTLEEYGRMSPRAVRQVMREGRFTLRTTRNIALGHLQCTLVVLPCLKTDRPQARTGS